MSPQPRPETTAPRTGARDGRVTVAVITRDRPAGVLRTVNALTALPERPPVIVVDNSSDDSTLEALRHHPSPVRVLRPGRNTGAVGLTLAVRQADTPYVAFSDDDSWWTHGSLRQAADLLDRHPRLGLLAARTLVGPERAEDPLNAVLAASPLPREADLPGRPVLGFLACASVVRRAAYLGAGGYHPLLFFGGEETLLAYDLMARGWGVTYAPSLTARHHPEPGDRDGRGYLLRRNEVLTLWLRRPPDGRGDRRRPRRPPRPARSRRTAARRPGPAPAAAAARGGREQAAGAPRAQMTGATARPWLTAGACRRSR